MKEEILALRKEINQILKDNNLDTDVKIIPATKMQSIETINELTQYGIDTVGENRVQELLEKYTPDTALSWQFIGVLQTNKVKYIVDKVTMIQSVDSVHLAKEIDRQCRKIDKIMPILVEVNYGREPQKSGILPEQMADFIAQIRDYNNISIQGIMSVMPKGADKSLYKGLHEYYLGLKATYPQFDWQYLSVGMTSDYALAVANGSNMVRIGEKIFGKRIYNL